MTFTAEEIKMIRSALCDKSMKTLSKVIAVQHEETQKGLDNKGSQIFENEHTFIRSIIAKIDERDAECQG